LQNEALELIAVFYLLIDVCIPVEESNDNFKKMIQKAHTYPQLVRILSKLQNVGQETSPKLKHRYAQSLDPECRISFLRRIKIILDTEKLYTELVKGTQFWGFLGTEDAGKSTFIKVNIK
jgi:GTP-binding protein EngB required for normal cell division